MQRFRPLTPVGERKCSLSLAMNARRKPASLWAGIFLVCLCHLVACSRSSDSVQSDATPPPINPCSVLSSDDFKTALGKAPTARGSRENLGPIDKCTWSLPDAGDVAVTFYNQVGPAAMFTQSVSSRTSDDKTYEPIPGLGDQAVYREGSRPVFVSKNVEVVRGKRHFDVHYVDAFAKTSGPSKGMMVVLAGTILAHSR